MSPGAMPSDVELHIGRVAEGEDESSGIRHSTSPKKASGKKKSKAKPKRRDDASGDINEAGNIDSGESLNLKSPDDDTRVVQAARVSTLPHITKVAHMTSDSDVVIDLETENQEDPFLDKKEKGRQAAVAHALHLRIRHAKIKKIASSLKKVQDAVWFGFLVSESTDSGSCLVLLFQIAFSGCMNGFLSFSIIPLSEDEGFTTVMIGALIPCSSVANIICNLLVGSWQGKIAHKALFIAASVSTGIGSLFCATGNWIVMLIGFALCGAGLGVMGVLPFVQCKLYGDGNSVLYQKWYMLMNIGLAFTFGTGRIYMAASTLAVGGFWGWRIPWILVGSVQLMITALLVSRPYMGPVHAVKKTILHSVTTDKLPVHSVGEAVRHFYLESPLSLMHVLAYPFLAFSSSTMSIWYPAIAKELYSGIDDSARTLYTLCCLLTAAPVGLLVTGMTLPLMQHIRSAVRANWSASFISFVALFIITTVRDFGAFCALLTIYVVSQYFPFFFVKQMPFTIGLTGNVSVFAVSQLVVLYTIFGDVAGSLAFGAIAQAVGYGTGLYFALGSVFVGCFTFSILLFLSYANDGIVHERVREEAREKALLHWDLLRQHVLPNWKTRERVSIKLFAIKKARSIGSCNAIDMAEMLVVGVQFDAASDASSLPKDAASSAEATTRSASPSKKRHSNRE